MDEKKKRVNVKRTNKRIRSGAHEECPKCGKKLRGAKGMNMHVTNEHADARKAVA